MAATAFCDQAAKTSNNTIYVHEETLLLVAKGCTAGHAHGGGWRLAGLRAIELFNFSTFARKARCSERTERGRRDRRRGLSR